MKKYWEYDSCLYWACDSCEFAEPVAVCSGANVGDGRECPHCDEGPQSVVTRELVVPPLQDGQCRRG